MIPRRVLSAVIGIVVALVAVLPASGAESTLDVVKKRGVLIAGVRYDMPPYGAVDKDGKVVGIDIEIAKYIAEKLGVRLELKQVTAKTRIPMLVNGNVDLLAAGIAHTIEREQAIDFSVTYLQSGTKFLVKRGSGITSYRDLAGKTVATIQGTPYAGGLLKREPSVKFVTFQEYAQAVVAVEHGKADALMADDTTLANLVKGRGGLQVVGDIRDFPRWFVALGVRQNDSKWRNFVNLALQEMWEQSLWRRVITEYGLEPDPKFEIEVWKF
jgi:polar amino acid transport system substrate-binding protein